MNHQQFFSQAGQFINHSIYSEGISPQQIFIVRFDYQNGHSKFDGRNWSFHINAPAVAERNIFTGEGY